MLLLINDLRERVGGFYEIMEEERTTGVGKSVDQAELCEAAPAEIGSDEEEDFEFAFSIESDPDSLADASADEIFYNGRIRPVYPLFNRDLIGRTKGPEEEEEKLAEGVVQLMLDCDKDDMPSVSGSSPSSIASEEKNVDLSRGAASANFVPRKSCSTGSSASASASRRWNLRDFVVGRSRSDGKERFVVIPLSAEKKEREKEKKSSRSSSSSAKSEGEKKEKGGKGKGEAVKEMDIVTAHRIYYGKAGAGGGQPLAAGSGRRSFLPYRQELLGGIFGNAKHHIHPF